MRLRLRCGVAYKLGDLQWCMVHVPEHLHTVRDLAVHISSLLELDSHRAVLGASQPPQLLLEGFLVPHEEELQAVLRDDEVVDVEPSEPSAQGLLPICAGSPAGTVQAKRPLDAAVASGGGSTIWNGMIAPLAKMRFASILWYQGESNYRGAVQYACHFPAMIHDWRAKFASPSLPFYFVQLAPCYGHKDCGNFVNVRNAQMAGLLLPNGELHT